MNLPHYAVFSNLLSLHLSSVQLFSSGPCSQTPSVYGHMQKCPRVYIEILVNLLVPPWIGQKLPINSGVLLYWFQL
jgi:hypothetical protein